jgi:hypothetical protein
MIMLKRFSALLFAALMVSALGCATQSEPQSPGAYMDDSWVTTQVKTAILNEPSLKVLQINVETYKGVVQLSGFVDSPASQAKAIEIARAVEGVTSVKNDMRLRWPPVKQRPLWLNDLPLWLNLAGAGGSVNVPPPPGSGR